MVSDFTPRTTGWLAIAIAIVTIVDLVFITLFFAIGQPWGIVSDVFIALEAILSAVLAWMLLPICRTQSPRLNLAALIAAEFGALVVILGSALVLFGITDYVEAGHYMSFGYGCIGLWLLALSYLARRHQLWPPRLLEYGLVVGTFMVVGLLSIYGIIYGIDASTTAPWFVNVESVVGLLGWAVLYPIWCIWLGRLSLAGRLAPAETEGCETSAGANS